MSTEMSDPPNEQHDWDQAARDTYQRLREKADQETPKAWMPTEAGDDLVGVLVDVNVAAPTKFGPSPVVTIKRLNDGELVSLWLLHAVLRREFERKQPLIGETVLVRYDGKVRPEGGGNDYDMYTLVLDRPEGAAPSWDAIADRYKDTPHLDQVEPEPPPQVKCEQCGFVDPDHAVGCPNDIPF